MVKNNYSSGRNDDRLINPNGKNVPQAFVDAQEEGPHQNEVLQCHAYSAVGQMNIGTMLVENIRSHDYFKGLSELASFEEVVDQTYYDCKFVTPWVPGTHRAQRASGMCSGLRGVSNAGQPSTCYMLVFKLFTLQITRPQIKSLLTHTDSPYIRCTGFLFLRYVCEPKALWGWYEPFLNDEEKFSEEGNTTMTTIGEWLRRLLIEQEYHDTMLPRLPVPVMKDFQTKVAELRAAGGGGRREEGRDGRDGRDGARDERGRDEAPSYRDLDAPGGRSAAPRADRHREYGDDDRRDDRFRDERRDDRRDERGGGYGGGGHGGGGQGGGYGGRGRDDERRRYDERPRHDDRRERDERREYPPSRPADRPPPERPAYRDAPAAQHHAASADAGRAGLTSMSSASSTSYVAGGGGGAAAAPAPPAPKVETAAEKLARLRAKQAARAGGAYLTGKVGADYDATSSAPAKGLARYQQVVRDDRRM
jgi:pre-mRNA-splicing factor 38B